MNSAVANTHARRFRDGLRRERRVYETLLETTRSQAGILDSGMADEILELARARDSVLRAIDEIEQELVPLKQRWTELRDQVELDLRLEIEHELSAVRDVLERLIELEDGVTGEVGAESPPSRVLPISVPREKPPTRNLDPSL